MVKIAFLDKFGLKFGKNLKNKVRRMNLYRFNMTMTVSITMAMTVTGKGHGNISSL